MRVGGLQEQAHDQAIRSCRNEGGMRDLMDRRGNHLPKRDQ